MALFEMMNKLIATAAQVGKYTHGHVAALYNKTVRITRIVILGKCSHGKSTNSYRFACAKGGDQMGGNDQSAIAECAGGNVNRELIFFAKRGNAADVVCVFMRNKDGFHFGHVQPQPIHPLVNFSARYACIYQHSFVAVANVVAISIATRV